ncbi:MAG: hypothetical protein HQM04_01300 [Magnetococcales bacterium]|nr:hypothetical protein [Magnetococcales bacterium]MBF0113655.1 hypothetical protein [Magnetococcales bacterium]
MKGWTMWSSRLINDFASPEIGMGRVGRISRPARLAVVLAAALLVGACAPRVNESVVPVQRSDLTLDLPLEPSSPLKSRPIQSVQTVPPPLGSLPSGQRAVPSGLEQGREIGIPAREGGAVLYAPSATSKQAAVSKKKSASKKKAVSKKKKAVVKKRTSKRASTSPCMPAPAKVKKTATKAAPRPATDASQPLSSQ